MASSNGSDVSSAEFVRRFGAWQDRANSDPIFITHHGRRRHVMLSMHAYEQLVAAAGTDNASDDDRLKLEILTSQFDGSFVALDASLAIAAVNRAACTYFGLAAAAVIGRPSGAEMPELERSVMRAHLARVLASGEIAAFDMPAVTHPGEWLRCTIFPYGGGVACLLRNVTAEKEARLKAQAGVALSEVLTVLDDVGGGRLSLRGTFSVVGGRLAALAGFAPSALEQVRLTDILPLNRRVEAAQHIEAVLNGGEARAFDTAFLVNNGGERPVRLGLAPVRGDYAVDGALLIALAL